MWLAGFLAVLPIARAEIIDRIMVTIGIRVITESEIERELRLTAFLNREPAKFDAAEQRKAADRLVEQELIRRELELSRYPTPTPDEQAAMLKQVRARFGGDAEFEREMKRYGVTDRDLREHLLWQLTLLRFVDMRFRPGVQVTDQEIEEYFEKTIKPTLRIGNSGPVSLDDYREKIEQTLIGRRVDQDLDRWLRIARRRTTIEYKGFR